MTDLQNMELGGGTQKTLWQLRQLVVEERPGEVRDHRSVKPYIMQRPDWQVEVSLPTKHSTPTAVQRKTLLTSMYRMCTQSHRQVSYSDKPHTGQILTACVHVWRVYTL